MRIIGFRAHPSEVTFVILDSDEQAIMNIETIKIPKALSVPESLKYVRNNILDILREYNIEKAGLRVTESNAQRVDPKRLQIEGVIKETFASSNLKDYYCGQISNISSRIGFKRTEFKKYIDGCLDFEPIENWSELNKFQREASLVALGACSD